MITDKQLFQAVLAMDSYNRGYDSKLVGLSSANDTLIGNVKIIGNSTTALSGADQASSFYAVAYEDNATGETIISYRGTNPPELDDAINGWLTGLGAYNYFSPQALLAAEFYKAVIAPSGGIGPVQSPYDVNASFVGHSLGGGLAGLMGSLYSKEATVFDNMPFEQAAANVFDASLPDTTTDAVIQFLLGPFFPIYNTFVSQSYNQTVRDTYYFNGSNPQAPSQTNVSAYATKDEVLEFIRIDNLQNTNVTYLDSNGKSTINPLWSVNLHSQALLVNLLFAQKGFEENIMTDDWKTIGVDFINTLFDDSVALVSGSDSADHMLNKIAYSTIDSGTTIFGDTAIRAMFNDANILGKLTGPTGGSSLLVDNSAALSQILVQFAGQLASDKVLQASSPEAVNGIFSSTVSGEVLNINFTNPLWGTSPDIIGRVELLFDILFSNATLAPVIRSAMQNSWGDNSNSAFDNIVLAALESGVLTAIPTIIGENTLFVGSNGNDTVASSNGNDMLVGGSGNDELSSYGGNDILIGGTGSDTIYGGDDNDVLLGGFGNDTLIGGSGDDTLIGGGNNDTYVFSSADTKVNGDTIIDSTGDDGIIVDGVVLLGSAVEDVNNAGQFNLSVGGIDAVITWGGDPANSVLRGDLRIDWDGNSGDDIVIKDFANGEFGIVLNGVPVEPDDGVNTADGAGNPLPTPPSLEAPTRRDPLVIDLDGDGLIYTDLADPAFNVLFDIDGDTLLERTGWIEGDDAFLVIDHNGNGIVDDIDDMIGGRDVRGFDELATLDDNNDGLITSSDAAYNQIQVWQDANIDGITDAGELSSLASNNIEIIALSHVDTNINANDNIVTGVGEYLINVGGILESRAVNEVDFLLENLGTNRNLTDFTAVDQSLFSLPYVDGFGSIVSLYDAMNVNAVLRSQVEGFSALSLDDALGGRTDIEDIMYEWADVAAIDPTSRGSTIDARIVHFFEEFTGGKMPDIITVPHAQTILQSWEQYVDYYLDSFLVQGQMEEFIPESTAGIGTTRIDYGNDFNLVVEAFAQSNESVQTKLLVYEYVKLHEVNFSDATAVTNGLSDILSDMLLKFYDISAPNNFIAFADAIIDFATITDTATLDAAIAGAVANIITDLGSVNLADNSLWLRIGANLLEVTSNLSTQDTALEGDIFSFLTGKTGITNFSNIVLPSHGNNILSASTPSLIIDGYGNSTLQGSNGDDTLEGNLGDDVLSGGAGTNTIIYNLGDGDDTISGSGQNIIQFGEGITQADVSFQDSGADLLILISSGGNILLEGHFASSVVQEINFIDGTIITPPQVAPVIGTEFNDTLVGANNVDDLIQGLGGDDQLNGFSGDDTLDGGIGNDFLSGGTGNDTYIYNLGDGDDVIFSESQGQDIILLGSGISESDISYKRVKIGSNGTDDIIITVGTSGTITIQDHFNSNNTLNELQLADGTILTTPSSLEIIGTEFNDTLFGANNVDDLIQGLGGDDFLNGLSGDDTLEGGAGDDLLRGAGDDDLLDGGVGNDNLIGFFGNDILDGGIGNDTLEGGAGDDIFIYNLGDGDDYIFDTSGGLDVIQFGAGIIQSDIVLENIGTDLLIQIGTTGSIRINNQFTTPIQIQSLIFDDGTIMALPTSLPITGTEGNDTLFGNGADNIIEGLGGDDSISGGAGDDIINGGDGNDTLNGGNNNDTLSGGADNDQLNGESGNDELVGGTGNDTLDGGSGNDTYIYNLGDGDDIIIDTAGEQNVIQFGSGIVQSDIILLRNGNDLTIKIGTTGSILIQGQFASGSIIMNELQFDNGNVVALPLNLDITGTEGDDILTGTNVADTLNGLAGNDTIDGNAGNDTISGGIGDDIINGGSGDDSYIYNLGDGNDVINSGSGTNELIIFGAGILAADIVLERVDTDLLVKIGTTGSILIANHYLTNALQELQFDDGSILALPDNFTATENDDYLVGDNANNAIDGLGGDDVIIGNNGRDTLDGGTGDDSISGNDDRDTLSGGIGNDILEGGADRDRLFGNEGNDTLEGGAGNDWLQGDIGDDTYIYGTASGDDTISENSGEYNIISFVDGIIESDITLQRDNNDLLVNITNNGSIVVRNQFRDGDLRVDELRFSDGTISPLAPNAEIIGTEAFDILIGSPTLNDIISGLDGGDLFIVYGGDDLLNGGGGDDRFVLAFTAGDTDTISDFTPNSDIIDITSANVTGLSDLVITQIASGLSINVNGHIIILQGSLTPADVQPEWFIFEGGVILGGTANDTLNGGSGADTVYGGDGDDVITGGAGDDFVEGAGGNDTLSGGAGNDTVEGDSGVGDDLLFGDIGDDLLIGGSGKDTLHGGEGNDTLEGGLDGDIFVFELNAGTNDIITDFDVLEDVINLGHSSFTGLASISDLTITLDVDSSIIDLGNGQIIRISGILPSELSDSNFAFNELPITPPPENTAPVLATPIVDQSTDEDVVFSFDVSSNFTDADAGDILTYSATLAGGSALPLWLSFDSATGIFSGTPDNNDVSNFDIVVTTDDGVSGSIAATDTFTITVYNINDAPVVSVAIADQSTDEDAIFSFTVPTNTFTDVDSIHGDIITLSATLADNTTSGGSALPTWLSFDAATGIFSGTPDNGDVSNLSVKVTATDIAGATAEDIFNLEIVNVNDDPVLTTPIVDQSTDEDAVFSFDASSNFTDVDVGDTLTYSATLTGGAALPSWLSFDTATGIFSGTPDNGDVGNLSVKVTATDIVGATAEDIFNLEIINVNDDPILAAPIADQSADEDAVLSFVVPANTFTDVDSIHGDIITLSATLADDTALPTWLNFDAATGIFSGTPDNGDVGNLSVKVTATDIAGATAENIFNLEIVGADNDGELINGTSGDDSIIGTAGDDTINGLAGEDIIGGDKGADIIFGGEGNDWLQGNRGKDTLDGGAGDDFIKGGKGKDELIGGTGNDTLKGNRGEDILNGGEGNDWLQGNRGKDILNGELGDDTLRGGKGDDILNGGEGNDILRGNRGDDILTGGEGADIFIFNANSSEDTITDFESGADLIDLTALNLTSFDLIEILDDAEVDNGVTKLEIETNSGNEIEITLLDVGENVLGADDFLI